MKWAAVALIAGGGVVSAIRPAIAAEGPTAAGPIGGTDIRSAQLPPPGLYGGLFGFDAGTMEFLGPDGETIPALRDGHLRKELTGPFFLYVPDKKLLGGSIGLTGYVPLGNQCGHLFTGQRSECSQGLGDPYLEMDWSRSFGHYRPSRDPDAYPIFQGLSVLLGFGTVFPIGSYDDDDRLEQVLSIGTNIWDFAPTMAMTYTTRPILAEGTEFSAKLFWNNYLENPSTNFQTGDLINIDFAVTEHMGPFQVGVTGFYAWQTQDDTVLGVPVAPDGNRVTGLAIGPIVNYDMPERNASLKAKSFTTVYARNQVTAWHVIVGWFQKF
ncbi:transporter [Methyloligella sp. 2.7D]|uniref:SphA family protein n=1 Tax=unclassified Methyloligella TaxID=2625955 RepID=UPI001ABBA49F|nr:transporter [Methyloligella sp. GL2]